MSKMQLVLHVTWTESEAGWGKHPDGISLHLDQDDVELYINNYWAKEKKRNPTGRTPAEYTCNDFKEGRAIFVDAEYAKKLSDEVEAGGTGLRIWQHEYRDSRVAGRIKAPEEMLKEKSK